MLDCPVSRAALVLLGGREIQASPDRTECLEPKVLQVRKAVPGLRDRRGTQDYLEQEDPPETQGCPAKLGFRANPASLG